MTIPAGWEIACENHLAAAHKNNPWCFDGSEAVYGNGYVKFVESWPDRSGDECEFCHKPMSGQPVLQSWHPVIETNSVCEIGERVCFMSHFSCALNA